MESTTLTNTHSWFLKINPNGRIPAILDGNQRVFESGAIMLYLTDKYDTERKISYAPGTSEYVEELSWLMFQMGGVGPMQGKYYYTFVPDTIVLFPLANGPKAKPTISVSMPAFAPTTALTDISTRPNVSTRSLSLVSRRARISRAPSIPLPTSLTIPGSEVPRQPWRLTFPSGRH